ncbi:transferase family-domain-containing protein [Lasiosphaeria hispida]|uniref:Transferase family-domain-containing protein n=1 Tax=Lasiosphaeria hispida TaxID=260671 RepID=A0AAJ0HX77_9PEZI|nr:transferase family-domain-containing protein [Lasiosphaeria hispida]
MEEPFNLDIIGQPPHLHIYTQLCLCFSVADDANRQAAAGVLAQGLEKLAQRLPWLAGKIVSISPNEGNSEVFKIVPWASAPPLVVRELRGNPSAPTMETLQNANFPMEMLDEGIIAPYMTIPGGTAGSAPDPTAVFAVQINHIDGGILLTIVAHHQVMDLVGQIQVMRLLSKACRGEGLSDAEVLIANTDRSNIIPPLGDDPEPVRQLSRQKVKPSPLVPSGQEIDKAVSVWASFSFSQTSLAALKAAALATATSSKISTDDALTALVWQSLTRARQRRKNSPNPESEVTLGRAVDSRRYLGIPKEYTGMINNMVYLTNPIQEIVNMPLGKMASELRLAVDPATSQIGLYTRALAALLHRTPDKGVVSMGAAIKPSMDLMLSSWAGADCYSMDFGLGLGPPVSVRRPRFYPVEGLGYLMPRHPSGQIVLAVCLGEEDMAAVRMDEEFGRYATYIG